MTKPNADEWMQTHGVRRVVVVSPHMDDAVFSLATWLTLQTEPVREVLTVFTRTTDDADDRQALAMGFKGPLDEYEARRAEDVSAMKAMGLVYHHADLQVDEFDDTQAAQLAQALRSRQAALGFEPAQVLVLLPAGAGGTLNLARRLWRRITRTPKGCGVHAEHVWVRDRLWPRLLAHGHLVGFYAEVPYLWANDAEVLHREVMQRHQVKLAVHRVAPNLPTKLAAIRHYRSQVADEFGATEDFQRKVASIDEMLLLPAAQVPA
jgi:LmbE family N-acetylglucosaminyl deacetylase